ncbi:M28 family metallopeptidase [Streptosporangium saharense]|uniref:Aminopeptidase Y n=1 Tax=Streptosporangium saharense TaxID=1706840 RepID=A0A7W7QH56_9ACTN|nr:M28 family metallopeptidase [Streptosporangium saharense]MBB4913443.1 aminopeptidase Y [Streptosporangium saharense]
MRTKLRRNAIRLAAVTTAFGLPLALIPSAQADPGVSAVQSQLINSVTAPLVKNHLKALQNIANANNGTRAAGTKGHDASRDYVAGKLRKAGWNVTIQPFEFGYFTENSTASLARISPNPRTYVPTEPGSSTLGEFATMTYSGSGDVTGTVQAVDVSLPPPPAPGSTSGCEAADFAGFTRGNIALVQRGTCSFEDKARNALNAGAAAVIVFNEGQPGRTDTVLGRLGGPGVNIPVVGTSFAIGSDLASTPNTVVRVKTDTTSETRLTHNVIADSRWGDPNKVVMLGAHLDSVDAGPGINDNGSGSAADLTVAEALGRIPTVNRLRFAWWSAEELGLLGSQHYVDTLTDAQRSKIKLYLNFDMVASPNYALKIYDGDDSDQTGAPAGPAGSAEIEKLFEKYFDTLRQPHNGTDFDGRSDYGPFIAVGIPSGGLFTGAEGIKTAEEARLFGGTAGKPYDGCYHQACDTIANINDKALALNTGAIATAAVVYAFSGKLPGSGAPAAAVPQKKALADVDHDGRVSR